VKLLARDVYLVPGLPPNANSYVVGDVLVNAGTRWGAGRLIRRVRDRPLGALLLTHVHPPTQGGAARVCRELGVEAWCGEGDAEVLESGDIVSAQPAHWFNRFQQRAFTGPGVPVARRLREGDRVADFEVLETPGHAPGHVALWREEDRVLILGDVVTNQNVWTGLPGLRQPPRVFTPDPALNRASARRLAALAPRLVCFDHGKPLSRPDRFGAFVDGLISG
jgi:glyoxylase-like metal-dependent hydrolase (beta-lactamase superfamily II)